MIRLLRASVIIAACVQTITIHGQDTQPPTVNCPPGIRISADESCEALIPDIRPRVAVSDDITPPAEIALVQSPRPGTVVSLGVHRIVIRAMDAAGNRSTCATSLT